MDNPNFTESIIIISAKQLPTTQIDYEIFCEQLDEDSLELILSGDDFKIYKGINDNVGTKELILYFLDKKLIN